MTETPRPTRYDVLRYPSKPYAHAHIDRMYVIGKLFGVSPPDVTQARVLELGCGSGGHLIPMAYQLPGATFVGLDLAPTSIDEANAEVEALGLSNIRFEMADLGSLRKDLGEFDYIIAHGVFSWVPERARKGLLDALGTKLSDNGIGYVSYNVLPGWHLHRAVRDLLRMHAELFDSPEEQVEQALSLLGFFRETVAKDATAYGALLRREHKMLTTHTPGYVFHDFMAPINEPMLFRDFVELAESHGLSYLGDVEFGDMLPAGLPAKVREVLQGVAADLVSLEQYLDFLRGNSFRRSLLMKGEQPYDRQISGHSVADLFASMQGRPALGEIDLTSDAVAKFETRTGATVSVTLPIAKAALVQLSVHKPADVRVRDLAILAREIMPETDSFDAQEDLRVVGGALIHGFGAGLVHFTPRARGHASEVADKPRLDPFMRHQMERKVEHLTNVRHETVKLSRFEEELALLCDGTRDHTQLLLGAEVAVAEGRLAVKVSGEEVDDGERVHQALTSALGPTLKNMVGYGIFVP